MSCHKHLTLAASSKTCHERVFSARRCCMLGIRTIACHCSRQHIRVWQPPKAHADVQRARFGAPSLRSSMREQACAAPASTNAASSTRSGAHSPNERVSTLAHHTRSLAFALPCTLAICTLVLLGLVGFDDLLLPLSFFAARVRRIGKKTQSKERTSMRHVDRVQGAQIPPARSRTRTTP